MYAGLPARALGIATVTHYWGIPGCAGIAGGAVSDHAPGVARIHEGTGDPPTKGGDNQRYVSTRRQQHGNAGYQLH
ncbi:hypothetical protein KCP78_19270 [Salmonella enterica subsp. enterica]|nr:hypothetical protein KCP78_19270 [Salmonella enterica subsp. enterica]